MPTPAVSAFRANVSRDWRDEDEDASAYHFRINGLRAARDQSNAKPPFTHIQSDISRDSNRLPRRDPQSLTTNCDKAPNVVRSLTATFDEP